MQYFYLFSSAGTAESIANFFFWLTTTAHGPDPSGQPGADVLARVQKRTKNLTVYMLSDRPSFEFCVHNARSGDDARCYVRYNRIDQEKRFAVLLRGSEANAVISDLFSDDEQESRAFKPFVFRTIRGFDPQSKAGRQFFSLLRFRIRSLFSTISPDEAFLKEIEKICFETPSVAPAP